jgi:hypothetical protein
MHLQNNDLMASTVTTKLVFGIHKLRRCWFRHVKEVKSSRQKLTKRPNSQQSTSPRPKKRAKQRSALPGPLSPYLITSVEKKWRKETFYKSLLLEMLEE